MWSNKLEHEDTTKADRTPKNLMEYIHNKSPNEDFFHLLAKHYAILNTILNDNSAIQEIKNAVFIIKLNKFSRDLGKIAKICAELDSEIRNRHNNLEKSRDALRAYDSKELAREIGSFYIGARDYDKYFQARHWLPEIDGRPLLLPLLFFSQPFSQNPNLSNEENICNLIASFRIHDDFFRNYLNVLYGDKEEGENFSGRSFEEISEGYNKITETVSEISKIIPASVPEGIVKVVEAKRMALEKIIKQYPATLYLATKNILLHLENLANKSLNLNSLPL